jgi:hypothetical protein
MLMPLSPKFCACAAVADTRISDNAKLVAIKEQVIDFEFGMK